LIRGLHEYLAGSLHIISAAVDNRRPNLFQVPTPTRPRIGPRIPFYAYSLDLRILFLLYLLNRLESWRSYYLFGDENAADGVNCPTVRIFERRPGRIMQTAAVVTI
jgi:hypothetical protein